MANIFIRPTPEFGCDQILLNPPNLSKRLHIYHTKILTPIHSHDYKLVSKVLVGKLLEIVYDKDINEIGRYIHNEGETYEIAEFHQVEAEVGTITLVRQIEPTGYLQQRYKQK